MPAEAEADEAAETGAAAVDDAGVGAGADAAAGPDAAGGGCHATVFTPAPSRAICTPVTMTSSPSASPRVTTQLLPRLSFASTSLRAALLSAPTTITNAPTVSRCSAC